VFAADLLALEEAQAEGPVVEGLAVCRRSTGEDVGARS
jgi:hypothetical protein